MRAKLWPIAVFILIFSAAIPADENNTSDDKQARLEKLRSEISKLQAALNAAHGEKDILQQQLRTTELDISSLNRSIRNLEQQHRDQKKRLQNLLHDKDEQLGNLDKQRQALDRQVRASFMVGQQGYLKILLSQKDPSTVGRTLTYYNYFNRARSERIIAIQEQIAELAALEKSIAEETAQLEKTKSEQLQKKDSLEQQRTSRQQIIASLSLEIDTKEERLKRYLEDEQELVRLINTLRETLADIPPEINNALPLRAMKGKLPWPAKGHISKKFGTSRNIGNLKWQGVMIDAGHGQEVTAIHHGRVAYADWLRGFGLLIIIDHGDGFMSLYGHNQSLYISVGDWVEAGALIATVGDSGGRATPGLYFEIRHNGVPSNPVLWCKAR